MPESLWKSNKIILLPVRKWHTLRSNAPDLEGGGILFSGRLPPRCLILERPADQRPIIGSNPCHMIGMNACRHFGLPVVVFAFFGVIQA